MDGTASPAVPARRRGRKGNPEARRLAILEAALDGFLAEGFAATSLDAIARRAGVAKGTIYLYFADKEALFRALVRETVSPVIAQAEALAPLFPGPARDLLRHLARTFVREVIRSERRRLVRLVLSEAPRFPWLAEVYWEEVVGRAMAMLRGVSRRAVERGEFAHDLLERFPQLLPAPLLVGFLWTTLFDRFEPLDVEGLVDQWLDLLLPALERPLP